MRVPKKKEKASLSTCYKLGQHTSEIDTVAKGVASYATTANHWSDDITTRAWVAHVVVPYFREAIRALRARGARCKPFGEQVCVIILDCAWMWGDAGFVAWLRAAYPWIRRVYVPGRRTPVAQPCDAGLIAKIKGKIRRSFAGWIMTQTTRQLDAGPAAHIYIYIFIRIYVHIYTH